MQSFHGMIVLETGDFKCGPFVLQPLSDREFASYPFHFFGNGLVQNPRVYFVVLMSVCPSIFTTDSIEILLASATVANVCLAINDVTKLISNYVKKKRSSRLKTFFGDPPGILLIELPHWYLKRYIFSFKHIPWIIPLICYVLLR